MTTNLTIQRPTLQKIWSIAQYGLVFIAFFLVQYKFLNDTWFGTDELDIMLGGKAIANGFQLYGDFISQHMPFSYYLSAVFEFFGAGTVTTQRFAFYLFYALVWTFIYARYQRVVSKAALFFYPICFSFLIVCYDMGTTILSEHLAGLGFVILFLEFLNFYEKRKLKLHNYLVLSLAVLLTFGTIFIGIFGIFAICMGVLICEIRWAIEDRKKITAFIVEMCKKYIPLFFWVAVPWIVLFVYYFVKNNVRVAFFSAYTINRAIYPKYNGFGDNILKTLLSGVDWAAGTITGLFNPETLDYRTVVIAIVAALVVLYLVWTAKTRGKFLCAVLTGYLMLLGVRGFFNFHGTHSVAVISLMITIVMTEVLIGGREAFAKRKLWYKTLVAGLVVMISAPYMSTFSNIGNRSFTEGVSVVGDALHKITEEREGVWQLSFSNEILIAADRTGIQNVGATPWMWEAFGNKALSTYGENPPRVALYNKDSECWGHLLVDYAPELVTYMDTYYTQYGDTQIYIRNDYYEEALEIINSN